jgi:CHAT domain-containing protein
MLSNDVGEMEEMADLCRQLIASDDSTSYTRDAIFDFSTAAVEIFRRDDTKNKVLECVIDVLRVATKQNPGWHHVSFALSHCLAIRFQMTHTICYYDEAMTTADEIIASRNPGDVFTPTQKCAIELIVALITDRLNFRAQPEYLVDSKYRLQSLRDIPCLPERLCSLITEHLGRLRQSHHDYFSVTRNSEVPCPITRAAVRGSSFSRPLAELRRRTVGPTDHAESGVGRRALLVKESLIAIRYSEATDIEETIKYNQILVPSRHFGRRSPLSNVNDLGEYLLEAYRRTCRSDHLNEAIITSRHVLRNPGTNRVRFQVAERLLTTLDERWRLFHGKQDFEEMMTLFSEQVKSVSEVAFRRFRISCQWASKARPHTHPCTSDAYENAMSLMQETLVFSPTLQTQHFRLLESLRDFEGMPLDYASYQIEKMKLEEVVQTLERGRTLLWSEMRGFRPSTDQLFATEPSLAEIITYINRELEEVTMSAVKNKGMEFGNDETGGDKGMADFRRLVLRQRELLKERDSLVSQIRTLPSFENFLKPPSFDVLNQAASCGPVIIVNQSTWRSDILILLKDSPPSLISTRPDLHDRAKALKDRLFRSRRYGLNSANYDKTLASVLADLYTLVGKLVIDRLRELKIPKQSRVWWCPTAAFCSLPLHAMGPIPSDNGEELYFMDLYITSYTTSLSSLIESRKHSSRETKFDIPPILLVALPRTSSPAIFDEITVVRGLSASVTPLIGAKATPPYVMKGVREHRFAHIACRGTLEEGKPFDASFGLYDNEPLTLLEIVRSRLPAAEFAFLSACHTAALTSGSVDDEALHLTAAVQYCGFRSAIGTSWAMVDMDGPFMAKFVYGSMFIGRQHRKAPYYERSAKALQYAVRKLRRLRGITLERWVNFVHYGA